MAEKTLNQNWTADVAVAEMLTSAEALGLPTAFSRARTMKPCPISTHFVASGVYTLFGVSSPAAGNEGWEKLVGGKLEFITDLELMLNEALAYIDAKRAALNLPKYDPGRWGASGGAVIVTELNTTGRQVTQHHDHFDQQLPDLLANHCQACQLFRHRHHMTFVCERR